MKKFPFLPLLHQDRHTSFSPLHLDKPLCLPSSKGSTPAGSLHLDWVISREEAFQNQWLTLHLFPNSSFVQKKPQQHMSKRLFFRKSKGRTMQPGLGVHGQKPANAGNLPFVIHYAWQPRVRHQVLHIIHTEPVSQNRH